MAHLEQHSAMIVLRWEESGCPGVSCHPKPNYSLSWGEAGLDKVEEEPPLLSQLESEVPLNLTANTIWHLYQPIIKVHEDLAVMMG